uniref:Dolichol phosphate-mannose biosynthesis regulatory protein n=1 Tax=Terrapene triunguis TaxID=2587831 RepID=A0A674KAP1_9SAUR
FLSFILLASILTHSWGGQYVPRGLLLHLPYREPHLTFFPLIQETVIGLSAFSLAVLGPAGWFLFHLPSYKKNASEAN